jgi:hypothetical protein
MNYTFKFLLAVAVGVLVSSPASGALATWDFATAVSGPLSNYAPSSTGLDTVHISNPGLSSSGGAIIPSVASGVLTYEAKNQQLATDLNGANLVLSITLTTGSSISGLSTSYSIANSKKFTSATGTWSYRIGSTGAWNQLGTDSITSSQTSYADTWFTLPTVTSGQTLQFQFTLTNVMGENGSSSLSFDNFSIGATQVVPEPIAFALPIFGLVFIGGTAGKYYLGRKKAAKS